MSKNKNVNMFLVLLLILFFLLISFAAIPFYGSDSSAYSNLYSANETANHHSMSLIIQNIIDCRQAETLFKYYFLQNIQAKWLIEESCFPMLTALNITALGFVNYSLYNGLYPHMSSIKIAEYQHDKDGML